MHLVVGLGNPGVKYEQTRHNVGFRVLNEVAKRLQVKWKSDTNCKAEVIETHYLGEKLVLAKPQTFMNRSGEAVQALAVRFKIDPSNIWVAYDEAALSLGTIRVRLGGSSGGHNGVKSIIDSLGTDAFGRFRLGINLPHEGLALDSYVLSRFAAEETEVAELAINQTATHILEALREGLREQSFEVDPEKS